MGAFAYEIQQTMPKVQAVERLHTAHKQQPENAQQNFAATVQQNVQEQKTKVIASSESEKGKISKDKKDKLDLSGKKDKKKKKKNDEDQHEEAADSGLGHLIDISA